MFNFLLKTIMVIVKIVVVLISLVWNLAVLAFKAAFIKKDEIKANAPEYKAALKEQFETLDVTEHTSKFTNVFDTWKTRLTEYVSKNDPAPQAELLALPAPKKDAA